MSTNIMQHSFASGEISQQIAARTDLTKYHTGAALLRNFLVDYRGGAMNRSGSRHIGFAKATTYIPRLVRFQFSTIQGYMLEIGHYYMRVIMNGGYVLEGTKAITGYSSGVVTTGSAHGYSTGDLVYITAFDNFGAYNSNLYEITVLSSTTFSISMQNNVAIPAGVIAAMGTVARVYTLTTPWHGADVFDLSYAQSADVITFCHPNYAPQDITRTGHAAWTVTAISFDAAINPPGAPTLTHTGSITYTTTFGYVVTAVNNAGEESIASDVGQQVVGNIATAEGSIKVSWTAVSGALYYNIYKCITDKSGTISPGVQFGWVGTSFGCTFTDNNITANFTKTPPRHTDPFAKGALGIFTITNGGTGYAAGTTATITDPTGTGAIIQPIIISGVILGFYVINRGRGYTNPTITLGSVGSGTGFAGTVSIGASSGTYPATVTYFQQRKIFASSTNNPTTLWASRPASFKNMDVSIPTNDGDAYTFALASMQVNAIKSLVPMAEGMLILTAGGVWQLIGTNGAAVTPSSAMAKIQSYEGATALTPITINHDVLYVQARGGVVRSLSYNFYASVYTGQDLTVLSAHLFYGKTISSWAYAAEPHKIIYAVRNDGTMLTLTYLKEQEVAGWAHSVTKGLYKDVNTLQEGMEDAVYYVVRRKLNGVWLNCIERQASRLFTGPDDYWFVDCGASYAPVAQATTLDAEAIDGEDVLFTAGAATFSAGSVGKVIRANGGVATITQYISSTQVRATFSYPMTITIEVVNGDNIAPICDAGAWTLGTPILTVGGLPHLEGEKVAILSDGNVDISSTVTNGQITLQQAASYVIIGIPYRSRLQTLPIDTGDPTIQGKRKKINAVSAVVENSRGLKAGPSFERLVEVDFRKTTGSALPPSAYSGKWRQQFGGAYDVEGQICLQQDYPLPCRILGVIPEITVGDT